MWFDAPMDGDEARIEELERGFRRDGLPNLVVDYSAAEDVFTRALPFFALVFAVEVVVAVDAELGWTGIGLVAAVLATLVMAFGVLNAVRGQRFFSVPERVDTPELVAFVVLPVLVSFAFGDRRLDALAVLAINLVIVGGTYVVVGFRLLSIVRWAGVRFFTQLRVTLPVLVRAVPLLLFFSLVMFFTTEIWQVFSLSPTGAVLDRDRPVHGAGDRVPVGPAPRRDPRGRDRRGRGRGPVASTRAAEPRGGGVDQ